MKLYRQVYNFFRHLVTARNTGGFGVHSPFMFQFIQNVLGEKHYFYFFTKIEALRTELLKDESIVSITDYGTGDNRQSSVKEIAKKSLSSPKYGQLLFRIAHYFNVVNVLELGTSLGISTAYLASSSSAIKCVTLEGCPQIAQKAESNFKKLKLDNIDLKICNIDEHLEQILKESDKFDLIFIDANHKSVAQNRYFELCMDKIHNGSILIIDDIYWSQDMENVWKMIKQHPKVTSTIDLFKLGIVFFNTNLHKKHYKINY